MLSISICHIFCLFNYDIIPVDSFIDKFCKYIVIFSKPTKQKRYLAPSLFCFQDDFKTNKCRI